MRTLNFSDYSLSRFISLYTSFPGFYSRKKKRVQSTKKQNFFITVHSRAVIRNFFSSEKKVFESVATFDVSLLCPSKLSLLHNLQDKQEKGNLDAHRWRIEGEVRFFMYSFVLQQVEYYTKMSSFFQSAFSFLPVRHVRGHMAWNAFFSFKVVNPS